MIDNILLAMMGGKEDPKKKSDPPTKSNDPKIIDQLSSEKNGSMHSTDAGYRDYESVLDMIGKGGNPFAKNGNGGSPATAFIAGRSNPATQKLVDQIAIHNQRYSNLSPEERVQKFFDTTYSDPQIQEYVDNFKTRGQGPVEAYKTVRKFSPLDSPLQGMLTASTQQQPL